MALVLPGRAPGYLALEHPVSGGADLVQDQEGGGGPGADTNTI